MKFLVYSMAFNTENFKKIYNHFNIKIENFEISGAKYQKFRKFRYKYSLFCKFSILNSKFLISPQKFQILGSTL